MTAVFPSLPGLDIGVKRTVLTSTGVQSGTSGTEQRASWWSSPKYEYEVTFNALRQLTGNFTVSQDEAQALSNFFTGLGGQFGTFYFADPLNSLASALSFGAGDGSTVTFSLTDMPTSRTNYCLSSQLQSNWALNAATLTAGIVDPAGGFNAFTLTSTGAGAYIYTQPVVPFSATYTNSLWVRRRTGTGQVQMEDPSGAGIGIIPTASWVKYNQVNSSYGPTECHYAIFLATTGDAVDIAFAQCELGPTVTSYIPTTTTPVTVTDYTLSGNTVTLDVAPLAGAALTWSGSFYYKVRFVQDNLDYEQIVIGAWKGDSLKIRTVKG
jgi:hypothetical protein